MQHCEMVSRLPPCLLDYYRDATVISYRYGIWAVGCGFCIKIDDSVFLGIDLSPGQQARRNILTGLKAYNCYPLQLVTFPHLYPRPSIVLCEEGPFPKPLYVDPFGGCSFQTATLKQQCQHKTTVASFTTSSLRHVLPSQRNAMGGRP